MGGRAGGVGAWKCVVPYQNSHVSRAMTNKKASCFSLFQPGFSLD
jgi:hypothetical protein